MKPAVPVADEQADSVETVFAGRNPLLRAAPAARVGKKTELPVFDDQVQRVFRADAPNRVRLTEITEHRRAKASSAVCAIKDARSTRIVGYPISDRMTAKLAVDAPRNAAARRGQVA